MPSSRSKLRVSNEVAPSEIEAAGKRTLMRVILAATGLTLGTFASLQYLDGNHLLALCELFAATLSLLGAWRVAHVRQLDFWIYLYIVPTSSFLVYIIVMPNASATAFVWVYLIPLLCYLLLGRLRGFLLAVPFMVLAVVLYFQQHRYSLDAAGLIDLGNAVLCGLLLLAFVHIYETMRARAYLQLQRLAQTDALTGVESRGSFQQALERSLQEAERSQLSVVLVILDVDHFKQVNDEWGHDAGDMALQHLCKSMVGRVRVTDTIGRLGGEEFGLVLRNTNLAAARPVIEALRAQISSSPLHYDSHQIKLSATFGLAEWPNDGRTADELYRCADRRLYCGKLQGRNQLISSDEVPGHAATASQPLSAQM